MSSRERRRPLAGPPPSDDDIERSQQESTEELKGGTGASSGIAGGIGAAMLGLDMAIRREPPAQVVAAEHMPERGISGPDGDLVIELPYGRPSPAAPVPLPLDEPPQHDLAPDQDDDQG